MSIFVSVQKATVCSTPSGVLQSNNMFAHKTQITTSNYLFQNKAVCLCDFPQTKKIKEFIVNGIIIKFL